ncbi:hypothetical protein GGF31_003710 [Allomyces arbusculus]|nr:hypothetical protein GGF31_003710 [Allomyces arbusculus]
MAPASARFGFPFKYNANIVYQFLVIAIDRDKADLLEKLLLHHLPDQYSSYKLQLLLPILLRVRPDSPNRTCMVLALLQFATVDERVWVDLVMQQPIIVLLNDMVRATLGNVDSPDCDSIPLLSLFVFDVLLFANAEAATTYLDAAARQDLGFRHLINTFASAARNLRLVKSLHLRYLWMRDTPTDVLDIMQDYAPQHALDATLHANVCLLGAICDGNTEAIANILLDSAAAKTPSIRKDDVSK